MTTDNINRFDSATTSSSKSAIRKHFRDLRRMISPAQQTEAADGLLTQFIAYAHTHRPRSIAAFIANDGELSPHRVVEYCWQHGISTYLPVVDSKNPGYLQFYSYTATTPMQSNRYGIDEPDITYADLISPFSLDWVLMPLVAFTPKGQRLGMGGGFYDRTFALSQGTNMTNTQLIGLAHECQCTEALPIEPWDIDMSGILTPKRHIRIT